ncbi:MAG: hypothetical protein ACRDD1_01630 [Planctomycetia bacterium]
MAVSPSQAESSPPSQGGGWPGWAKALAGVALAGHFVALGGMVFNAPSGPWATAEGADMASPPMFAQAIYERTDSYLVGVKFTNNYHFVGNRPEEGARFVAILRDADGKEIERRTYPEATARSGVRARQQLLADTLASDQPVVPAAGENVPGPGQAIPTVVIWDGAGERAAKLATIEEHLIPRNRPVFGPTAWSRLAARSFARHLGRTTSAASVEIVRQNAQFIPPDVLYMDPPPSASFFEPNSFSYGVHHVASTGG